MQIELAYLRVICIHEYLLGRHTEKTSRHIFYVLLE